MKKVIYGLAIVFAGSLRAAEPPALVELFTSFNCPACPAADKYATEMQAKNQALILSYHVDYWNTKNFTDPYSHYDFTQRQYDYSNTVGERPGKVFTPQMVVDGYIAAQPPLNKQVPAALARANALKKKEIMLKKSGDGVKISFPRIDGFEFPVLWVVGYNDTKMTTLEGGRHQGRRAISVNPVMYLAELPYSGEMALTLTKHQIPRTDNLAVFLQEAAPGKILALGILKL